LPNEAIARMMSRDERPDEAIGLVVATMSETTIASASPSGPGGAAGRPRWQQLLLLVGAGIVLAFGGCLLAIANSSTPGLLFFGAFFVAGILMIVVGVVGTLIVGLAALFKPRVG
jgi:hypothetical protein